MRILFCALALLFAASGFAGQTQNVNDLRMLDASNKIRIRQNADGVLKGYNASGTETFSLDTATAKNLAPEHFKAGTWAPSGLVKMDWSLLSQDIGITDSPTLPDVPMEIISPVNYGMSTDSEPFVAFPESMLDIKQQMTDDPDDLFTYFRFTPSGMQAGNPTPSTYGHDVHIVGNAVIDGGITAGAVSATETINTFNNVVATDGIYLHTDVSITSLGWLAKIVGCVIADSLLANHDIHAQRNIYALMRLIVGTARQTNGPEGSIVWQLGTGGRTPVPYTTTTLCIAYPANDGMHFRTHYDPTFLGLISNAFWFDDAVLATGNFETSGTFIENTKRVVVPSRVTTAGTGVAVTTSDANGTVIITGSALTTEADTLNTVTGRGATTANAVTLSNAANDLRGVLTIGSGGTQITKHLSATASLDFDFAGGQSIDQEITVTGAAVGDTVALGARDRSASPGEIFWAFVTSPNTVIVRGVDVQSQGNDASGTYRVDVWKH
jgi:hypothetical protein